MIGCLIPPTTMKVKNNGIHSNEFWWALYIVITKTKNKINNDPALQWLLCNAKMPHFHDPEHLTPVTFLVTYSICHIKKWYQHSLCERTIMRGKKVGVKRPSWQNLPNLLQTLQPRCQSNNLVWLQTRAKLLRNVIDIFIIYKLILNCIDIKLPSNLIQSTRKFD